MGRDVIDDDVVVDVVFEVACHQEAQPTTIIISKVVLDEISVDIYRAAWGKQVWVRTGSSPAIKIPPPSSYERLK